MKTDPLFPPDSFLGRPKKPGQPNAKIMVIVVVAIHVVVLGGLIFQGCHHKAIVETSAIDTNTPAPAQIAGASTPAPNAAVTPEMLAPPPNANVPPGGNALPESPSMNNYRIAAGDTLSRIAVRHHTTTAALLAANPGITATALQIGQVIRIPSDSRAAANAPAPATQAVAERIYIVKSGDALERIARTHGTTVKELRRINRLSSDRLVVGKQLKMPSISRKQGDTAVSQ